MKKIFCLIFSLSLIFIGTILLTIIGKDKPRSVPEEYQNLIHAVNDFDEELSEISKRENIAESLMDINKKLHGSTEFRFIELDLTEIYTYAGKKGDQPKINAAYCGDNVFSFFDLKTENDIYFSKEDYVFNENTVPLILGNDMKNKYSIGDTIKFYRQGYLVSGKVIDFLCSDQNVIYFDNAVNVDDYFFIPFSLEYPDQKYDRDIKEYQIRTMLKRNNGVIVSDLKKDKIQQLINGFTGFYGLPDYILSASYTEKRMYYLIYCLIEFMIIVIGIIVLIVGIRLPQKSK